VGTQLSPAQAPAGGVKFDFTVMAMDAGGIERALAAGATLASGSFNAQVAAPRQRTLNGDVLRIIQLLNAVRDERQPLGDLTRDLRSEHARGTCRSRDEHGIACFGAPHFLDPDERREIEQHVTHTYEFLRAIPWTRELARVPDLAYCHHEKLDGTGYPRGLSAPEIPLGARLMTIADIDKRELALFVPLIVGALWLGVQPGAVLDYTGPAVEALTSAYRAAIGG
jgi:hypothetical protein